MSYKLPLKKTEEKPAEPVEAPKEPKEPEDKPIKPASTPIEDEIPIKSSFNAPGKKK